MLRIKDRKFFSKGKRGLIYTGLLGKKKVAIKIKNPDSKALNRIKNEAKWLQVLNKKKIGPEFIAFEDGKLVYKFVEGVFILEWLGKKGPKDIKRVLKNVLVQCNEMDNLFVNKEEMHNPIKHIIIGKKVVLLDFERCTKTKKPHNVTQFCQFLMSSKLTKILRKNKINTESKGLIKLLKEYKQEYSEKKFKEILRFLKV